MKERPILFSAPMVQAILAGHKTQTRRILKDQPPHNGNIIGPIEFSPVVIKKGEETAGDVVFGVYDEYGEWGTKFPFGKQSDKLWVKENFKIRPLCSGCYETECDCGHFDVTYMADNKTVGFPEWESDKPFPKRRGVIPSIHMNRNISRLNLLIKNIRIEQLGYISDDDCYLEGMQKATKDGVLHKYGRDPIPWQDWGRTPQLGFRAAWESINGVGSWDLNPWCWVIDFEVMK